MTPEKLAEILKNKPLALANLLEAAKMDDDVKKNLLPAELGAPSELIKMFAGNSHFTANYDSVDLPPFVKHTLIQFLSKALGKS